jgi:cytochrome P450
VIVQVQSKNCVVALEIAGLTHTPPPDRPLFRPPAPAPQPSPLGPFAMLATLRRNPIETWTEAHFEHFILSGRTILGNTAVISAPAGIRHILVDRADNYRKDDLQRRILAPGLGDGLLTAQGERWRTQRRVIAPLFSAKTLHAFIPAMTEAAEALAIRWSQRRDGAIIDVQKAMGKVTLETLQRTLFADGLGGSPDRFADALSQFFEAIGRLDPFDLLNLPEWLPRLTRHRSRPSLAFFETAVTEVLERRRRRREQNADLPRDLLTLLLEARDPDSGVGLSDEEIRANVITFIGAGNETTANALTWSLYLLAHAPEWQQRLRDEADRHSATIRDKPLDLVETRAVIEEAMRLYPPVASLSREAVDADDVLGRRIRKGTLMMIVPWIVHRHRKLWSDPDRFDPSRFLPGTRETIDRYAFLPFGAGPRVCIGAAFALQEAVIVLSTIMKHFRLRPIADEHVTPVQHITLRPRGGMPLIVERRR